MTTMESVIRSVSTYQEALCVYVTKATISHMMRELVKVFTYILHDFYDKFRIIILLST